MISFPLVADISGYQPNEPAFFQALKNQGVRAVIRLSLRSRKARQMGMPISILKQRRR